MPHPTLTIKQLLRYATEQFTVISQTPLLDAQVLLSHALSVTKAYLYTWPDVSPPPSQQTAFMAQIQRRMQGEPIAYILGQKEFWSLALEVTPATLIPRPETELLVELALKLLPKEKPCHLLEIGTGSGAIAIALAHECPRWQIDATDISAAALSVAQRNAVTYGLKNIRFLQSNSFNQLQPFLYTAILSNPPYLANTDPHLQSKSLQFEPQSALVAGNNGLEMLSLLIQQAPSFLQPQGTLILEHGAGQGRTLEPLMSHAGFHHIFDYKDISGHDRIMTGRLR